MGHEPLGKQRRQTVDKMNIWDFWEGGLREKNMRRAGEAYNMGWQVS